MRLHNLGRVVLRACFFASVFLMAMSNANGQSAAPAAAGPVPRINGPIDETNRVTLHGNTHPLARPQYDQGAVADSQPLHRMLLLLRRSPAQETALRNLLDQQQSRSSGSYHQWLTPQQFGQQFGPADSDIQTVSSWLTSHGLQVSRVSPGKTVIEFSGTAGEVRQAFQTEIHRYVVNGQEHFANASDPSIPAALAPVVAGPVSLQNFPKKAQSRVLGLFDKNKSTGKVTPETAPAVTGSSGNPLFTFSSEYCPLSDTCYALGPTDFATIYNVPSTVAGVGPGTGQTIAIVGDSQICTLNSPDWGTTSATSYFGPLGNTVTCGGPSGSDDVAAFRSLFGLPANTPSCPAPSLNNGGPVCVIVDGPDPGFNADETEGDLDVEWAGATAKNATIDFVTAEDTETTFGTDLAAEYIVDNDLAPVLSESYGACEAELLTDGNEFEESLWEQAAAEGISVVVSAGDSGAAGCDNPDAYPPIAAEDGAFVNGIASTPFNVAAGGTDFDITATNYPSQYWNPATDNTGGTEASVKSYVPETTWNDSCAQSFTGSLTACTNPTLNGLNIVGGGGGQSNCTTSEYVGESIYCTGGFYAKPAWQSGPYVTGLGSTDGTRDVPDISFFAADGFVSGSFYIICEEDLSTTNTGAPDEASCSLSGTGSSAFTRFVGVGGTSSAAPAFAATMALVNQQTGTRQGNPNYVLYSLASTQETNGTSCNSTTGPAAGCVFNDVTRGNDSVPCYAETQNCDSQSSTAPYGLLEQQNSSGAFTGVIAWNTGTGFDLATGLGTINIGNLVSSWSSAVGKFTSTTTSLEMCGPATCTPSSTSTVSSITHGTAVDLNVTVTPSSGSPASTTTPENAALIMTDSTCTQNNGSAIAFTSNDYNVSNANLIPLRISGSTLTSGTVATSYLVGGNYYVKAHYTGDGKLGGSDSSNCVQVSISPEPSTTTVTVPVVSFSSAASGETLTSASTGVVLDYGDSIILRADVQGTTSPLQENGTGNAGTVQFKDNGSNYGTPAPVNTEGFAELQTGSNVDFVSTLPLAVGSHSITATFSGNNSYDASSSTAAVNFTVTAAPTTVSVAVGDASLAPATSITVAPGTQVTATAYIDTQTSNNPSGGSAGNDLYGQILGTVTFTYGTTTSSPVPVTASSNTFDSSGLLAAQVTYTFTAASTGNVTATFTPSPANYGSSTSAVAAAVNVSSSSGFTLTPLASSISCSGAIVNCVNVTPGQTGSSPVTITSTGLSGNVVLTCAVRQTNPTNGDLHTPACSFTLNGSTSSPSNSVTLSGNGTNGLRYMTVTTTAASGLGLPPQRRVPFAPGTLPAYGAALALAGCLLLLFGASLRRRPATALFAFLLLAAGIAVGCSGGISNIPTGTGTGASGSSSGTTADVYIVIVTATPSTGQALATEIEVNVE